MAEKKKRAHKVSKGINGATKHPLTEVEKVLAGKGQLDSIREVDSRSAWRGQLQVSDPPWDAEAVAENKRLYPHLFEGDR